VAVSDGTMQDTALRISEVDIKISRHRISTFLSAHTAYDLLPNSGKVIALDVNLPVKQAFHILYEQCFVVCNFVDHYGFGLAGPYDSLKDVAVKILHNKVSTVPIIHSSAQDGSFPQLLHLASLSEILRCKSYSSLLCLALHIIISLDSLTMDFCIIF
ncbi:hypothetical protein B296_00019995, partial [Ensete ventricosum]